VIRFRRNFGQTAAFAAGFAHARGRLVVTSDGDLQNDPRDIPAMVAAGATKYGLSRTIRVILDLATVKFLLSYSTRPLQIFGLIGLLAGGLGALITGYLGYIRLFTHQGIAERPLLLLGVMLVFIGVQLLTFGLLAEVMARTYYESQDKPTYVIREVRETTDVLAAPAEREQGILRR
jgi:glycosyltransferase involved in cell wall biosynthesis